MNRRDLIRGMMAVPAIAVLGAAGCTTAQTTVAQTVVNDVDMTAKAFETVLPNFAKIAGINAATVATIYGWIGNITTVARQIVAGMSQSAAQPLVQQIESDVNNIVGVLSTLPLPPTIMTVVDAAAVLLPVIEAAVGLVTPASMQMRTAHAGMTPDEARAALTSIVH